MSHIKNDNKVILYDIVLTSYAKEKIAKGENLNISKFSLGDSEIDYNLYNKNHPLGEIYYDSAILSLPILQPNKNYDSNIKYKLFTDNSLDTIATINANPSNIVDNIMTISKVNTLYSIELYTENPNIDSKDIYYIVQMNDNTILYDILPSDTVIDTGIESSYFQTANRIDNIILNNSRRKTIITKDKFYFMIKKNPLNTEYIKLNITGNDQLNANSIDLTIKVLTKQATDEL